MTAFYSSTSLRSQTQLPEAEAADQSGPKIKKLTWSLAVNHRNLKSEIKRAFDLAKSAGQELDLTFIPEAA